MADQVRAAGGVVWRERAGRLEIALVHRPRYDDWSLPKGKAEPGEHQLETAVREVAEETGQRTRVVRPLGTSHYPVPVPGGTADKSVRWWSMQALGGGDPLGPDVDEVRWLAPAEAAELAAGGDDAAVVARFLAGPPAPPTVLLVRHAKAGPAEARQAADDARPLEPAGREQADRLATLLALFEPVSVSAAPVLRCRETVAPLARALGVDLQVEEVLGEQDHALRPGAALHRVREAASCPAAVLCSQGGAIPDVVRHLAPRRGSWPARKASTWVLSFHDGRLLSADHLPPPADRLGA